MNTPQVKRHEVIAALQRVNMPQPRVHIKILKKAYQTYSTDGNVQALLDTMSSIGMPVSSGNNEQLDEKEMLKREDLKLIYFECIWR